MHDDDGLSGFPDSARLVPRLVVLDSSASTNSALVELAQTATGEARAAGSDDFTTVVTLDQTAGRGRLGRTWAAPRGTSLAISVLVRPRDRAGDAISPERLGWLPLIAGVAMTQAVRDLVPARLVDLKWPNDVLVEGRKICGVLTELLPAADGVVIGAGVNLTMTREQLPVATATSLALEGAAETGADAVLSAYLERLTALVDAYRDTGADAETSGIRALAESLCGTLERRVRVELPGAARPGAPAVHELLGTAVGLDAAGRLLVRRDADQVVVPVAAGDVTHLRHQPEAATS
ncbi:MAG: biotin--[acetyl-CoA-carboxylase] ligase [Microbacteriaceae bacterium]